MSVVRKKYHDLNLHDHKRKKDAKADDWCCPNPAASEMVAVFWSTICVQKGLIPAAAVG
jgi:hypothetical protein